ncbi:hypothetical protein GO986_18065 [Deinococcus sp. HMF7620]|uniref:Uncharacterized protein n=1 Tax=Deinococcus arboris TaxID=2682977 RepID=A0A7C9M8K5_9DEIO|nr:hypothetical protein [Deinococcus arboris]MVN88645.1 hypothetical protein [Deinococcus arboris]
MTSASRVGVIVDAEKLDMAAQIAHQEAELARLRRLELDAAASGLEARKQAVDAGLQNLGTSLAGYQGAISSAIQQAATAAGITGLVAAESNLTGKAAGTYQVAATGELVVWSGSSVTARQPMLPTIATSVARVADITALRALATGATTVTVDDRRRGGTFVRALLSVAGAVDNGLRFAHVDSTYVWQRLHDPFQLHADWYREPVSNTAPQLQKLFDAAPRGAIIRGGSKTTGGALEYWPVAPWTRPDGRTDILLTLNRAVTLDWGANQYGGYIGYGTDTPGTASILEVSSRISQDFPGSSTEYGYRFLDLAILPTTGSPCAKHALILKPTASDNLADVLIDGGQFVATNPDGRAIYSTNTGNNGMFLLRIIAPKVRGGVRLEKLGDSIYIADGSWAGNTGVPCLWLSLLDPTNPTDAASQLHLKRLNMNAVAQALIVEDAATCTVEGLNVEGRNRDEGGAGNYGKHLVEFNNCGTKGGVAGQSARSYSGSRFVGNKILPADGGTYGTSSGASAVLFNNSRGWVLSGGAIGTSQVLQANNSPADNGRGYTLRACDDMTVDLPDLQLTTSSIGVDIESTTKNMRWRGATVNPIVPSSWTVVQDNGQGTMGLVKPVPLPTAPPAIQGFENVPGGDPLRYVKEESGLVRLFGMLRPQGGSAALSGYITLHTFGAGFLPAEIVRRLVAYETAPAGTDPQPTIRQMYARVVGSGNGAASGRLQLNAWANGAQDTTVAGVRDMTVDMTWHAPPA